MVNLSPRVVVFLTGMFLSFEIHAAERPSPERWQKQMDRFARQDAVQEHPPNGIVFVGSSSIRMWDLEKWFPGLPTLNRGFGGSHIADATHFLDLLVIKHRPRTVVLYAGDNDIAKGLTPAEVASDYREFIAKLHAALPETRVAFLAIKPSLARWKLYPLMKQANEQISVIAARDKRQMFLDIATPMIASSDGQPRAELFLKDGLHLNDAGYKLWSTLLEPHLCLPVAADGQPR